MGVKHLVGRLLGIGCPGAGGLGSCILVGSMCIIIVMMGVVLSGGWSL